MNRKIDLNTGSYFSGSVVVFGVVVIGAMVWLLFNGEILMGLLLAPIIIILLTTRKGLEINLREKYFNEYVRVLGWKRKERTNFDVIDGLFIKRARVSQTMNSHGGSRTTITNEIYQSYLLINGEKVTIFQNSNKQKLLARLQPVSRYLNIPITDDEVD